MTAGSGGESTFVTGRLNAALNAHDLEAFLACFHEDSNAIVSWQVADHPLGDVAIANPEPRRGT